MLFLYRFGFNDFFHEKCYKTIVISQIRADIGWIDKTKHPVSKYLRKHTNADEYKI